MEKRKYPITRWFPKKPPKADEALNSEKRRVFTAAVNLRVFICRDWSVCTERLLHSRWATLLYWIISSKIAERFHIKFFWKILSDGKMPWKRQNVYFSSTFSHTHHPQWGKMNCWGKMWKCYDIFFFFYSLIDDRRDAHHAMKFDAFEPSSSGTHPKIAIACDIGRRNEKKKVSYFPAFHPFVRSMFFRRIFCLFRNIIQIQILYLVTTERYNQQRKGIILIKKICLTRLRRMYCWRRMKRK